MIKSIWRYSHLALAVSSFLPLTIASVTGIFLAFEPILEKSKGFKAEGFDTITLAQSIPVLQQKMEGLQSVTIDENNFVIAAYSDTAGNNIKAYVNPLTGAILGTPQKQSAFFEFNTSLHRSLFLKETGRWLMGITAFFLILIALSAIIMVIQRQKGIKHFFSPIEKTNFSQYYHVVLGRILLLFILAIAISGAYLTLSRFVIKPCKADLQVDGDALNKEPITALADFAFFNQTTLAEVQSVVFPFSDFPEDYYTLKLKIGDRSVNQFTGQIFAKADHSKAYYLTEFSLRWHTGRSGWLWSLILAISSGYILFFIYSGISIAIKRLRSRSKNKFKAADCTIIILVGSENGNTYQFASAVFNQILKLGEKVYLNNLDSYQIYPKATHLIVMTSTYGEGDAPTNARHFGARLSKYPQPNPLAFSVIGFGSRTYADYCQFASQTDEWLRNQTWAIPLMDLVTVNDKSPQDFYGWLTAFTKATGIPLMMPNKLLSPVKKGLRKLEIVHKTNAAVNESFRITLKTKRFTNVVSGDLLAIYPQGDHRERLYSIGKTGNEIQLIVKLVEQGLGSEYLYQLTHRQIIEARIIKNEHFHFPKKAPAVIMICNGTGIAPFLGMIRENKKKIPCTLYVGFRVLHSFDLYKQTLTEDIEQNRLIKYYLALSREGNQSYVNELLKLDQLFVAKHLTMGGVIMICGSLAMQKDVMAVLQNIVMDVKLKSIASYKAAGKILTDCY